MNIISKILAVKSAGALTGSGAMQSVKVELNTDLTVIKRLVEAEKPNRINIVNAKKFKSGLIGINLAETLNNDTPEEAEPITIKGSDKIKSQKINL